MYHWNYFEVIGIKLFFQFKTIRRLVFGGILKVAGEIRLFLIFCVWWGKFSLQDVWQILPQIVRGNPKCSLFECPSRFITDPYIKRKPRTGQLSNWSLLAFWFIDRKFGVYKTDIQYIMYFYSLRNKHKLTSVNYLSNTSHSLSLSLKAKAISKCSVIAFIVC